MSGAICWPEQFPGERKMAERIWADADKQWPNRRTYCTCQDLDEYTPCRHCPQCGRFVSNITLHSHEIGGMLAVVGNCKLHGEQCIDRTNWTWEHFEDSDD